MLFKLFGRNDVKEIVIETFDIARCRCLFRYSCKFPEMFLKMFLTGDVFRIDAVSIDALDLIVWHSCDEIIKFSYTVN